MLPQLEAASRFDPGAHTPVLYGAERIGWVEPRFARDLAGFPEAFACTDGAVQILSAQRMDAAVHALAAAGWIVGWRNERYEVMSPARGEPLFTLERASFRRFGLQARTVHLNGWVRSRDGPMLWIARRSGTKPVDPGMLDNLVAGGVPAGSSPQQALLRECSEEADIPADVACHAVPAGRFRVLRSVEDGVNDEWIHAFDLKLPPDFAPVNRDGEVAQFMRLPAEEAAARIEADEFTVDAGAATIDFLWRQGILHDRRIGAALAVLRGANVNHEP